MAIMEFKARGRTYTINYNDHFFDWGDARIQFWPRGRSKLPFGDWHHRPCKVSKTEWKRLLKSCRFEVKKALGGKTYLYKGESNQENK